MITHFYVKLMMMMIYAGRNLFVTSEECEAACGDTAGRLGIILIVVFMMVMVVMVSLR